MRYARKAAANEDHQVILINSLTQKYNTLVRKRDGRRAFAECRILGSRTVRTWDDPPAAAGGATRRRHRPDAREGVLMIPSSVCGERASAAGHPSSEQGGARESDDNQHRPSLARLPAGGDRDERFC